MAAAGSGTATPASLFHDLGEFVKHMFDKHGVGSEKETGETGKQTGKTELPVSKILKELDAFVKKAATTSSELSQSKSEVKELDEIVNQMTEALNMSARDQERVDQLIEDFFAPDFRFISPFGRTQQLFVEPLTMVHELPQWRSMLLDESPLTRALSGEMVSTDSVQVLADGNAGVVTYTTMTKGADDDEVVKMSAVFEKGPNGWKCVHKHQTTGQEALDEGEGGRDATQRGA